MFDDELPTELPDEDEVEEDDKLLDEESQQRWDTSDVISGKSPVSMSETPGMGES